MFALVAPASAQQPGKTPKAQMGEGFNRYFQGSIGGYWPAIDTQVRLDALDGTIGTTLDFEDDLNVSDREVLPWVDLQLRFHPRHRLEFTYYDLERSGSRELTGEIRFGDEVFRVGVDVDSLFETKIYRLAYGFSFANNGKREVSLLAGVHVADVKVGVADADGIVRATAETTAPLPMLGLQGGVRLPWRWRFRGWGQVFALEVGDYKGSLVNTSLVFEHDTFKHLGFGFGYSYFDFDFNSEDQDFSGEFSYTFHGPVAYLNVMF